MSKLTIIIPVYQNLFKTSQIIDDAQKYNIEVVVVCDGSYELEKELSSIQNKYNNVICIMKEHSGIWNTRMKGLDYVKTKYFTFADSDDTIIPENMISLCNNMEYGDYNFGIGLMKFSFEFENFLNGHNIPMGTTRHRIQHEFNFIKDKERLGGLLNTVWSKIYSSEYIPFIKTLNQDVKVYEDTILPYYYASLVGKAFVTNKPIYKYQMRYNGTFWTYTGNIGCYSAIPEVAKAHFQRKNALAKTQVDETDGQKYYQNELDSITIRLFFQRIGDIFKDPKLDKDEKTKLVNLIIELLYMIIPNFDNNKYYKGWFANCELNDILNYGIAKFFLDIYHIKLDKKVSVQLHNINELDEYLPEFREKYDKIIRRM